MTAYPTPQTIYRHAYTEGSTGFGGVPAITYTPAVTTTGTAIAVYAVYPTPPEEEHEAGRDASIISLEVLGPAATLGVVGARDKITWQSAVYDVDGNPEDYTTGPFGFEPGIRVRLVRKVG